VKRVASSVAVGLENEVESTTKVADRGPNPDDDMVRRRTKIVATIGPASDTTGTLTAMAEAGMDAARITLAHGTISEAIERISLLRQVVPQVGVLVDLPGPKVRTSPFPDSGVSFEATAEVQIVSARNGLVASDDRVIMLPYPELVDELQIGDRVGLGDGGVSLVITGRTKEGPLATVRSGGPVRGRPGVTVPADRFSLTTPTPDDLEKLDAIVAAGVDAIAVSFVRTADEITAVRVAAERSARQHEKPLPMLVAKIETREALNDLDAIVKVADAVMVARGDLGVRVPLEEVPHLQKKIIGTGVRFGRPVITATQMLESMTTAFTPTRAEVADVANAVLDGTSAVMLSAETAIGVDPVGVVATMARIARRAEREFNYLQWGTNLGSQEVEGRAFGSARITAAIAAAAWRAAIDEDAAAIIACTRSGATARAISRFRPPMPIVATTPSAHTARGLSMSWGVDAIIVQEETSTDKIVCSAVQAAVQSGYATSGDVVVVLAGSPTEAEPATDTLRLFRIR
jgi:pyruvate kinase